MPADAAADMTYQDKASDIVNNANDYANETVGYPLDLVRRVITVSFEAIRIMNGLREMGIEI